MSGMTTRWFLGIAVGGAIALGANSALAQITPDTTLPNNSTVRLDGNTHIIEGGTRAGNNLFHSFREFSVPTGNEAHFNNAAEIQNIFSRVTGGSVSNIDGLIRANRTANLFLINPNGIVFGPNASLNVGGSFVGTTANAIQFGNVGFFSATNPEAPSPLLTINPSALLFNQIAAAPIQNNSIAPAQTDPAGFRAYGLRVRDGKSLLLVGGNISMDGGQLNAYGGRVELGGLAASGFVGLNVDGDKLSLDFPASSTRADISLTNGTGVFVAAGGGGDIAVNARNLEVTKGSQLSTGIGPGLGSVGAKAGDITLNATVGLPNTQAGDIKINATGIVAIADGSKISNEVAPNAVGNSGNININADSLSLGNNSFLAASTNGQGNAGNVTINTGSLSVVEGSFLAASANGQGNAGNININARDRVSFGKGSRAYTDVTLKGNGGDINITTGSLFVTDDSFLASSTNGEGNSGNITINARDTISFDKGLAYTDVGKNGKGQAGNFNITGESLSLTNGAQLIASTNGQGNAGNITINTGKISVSDNSFLAASANGQQGNAGNININARDRVSFGKGSHAYTNVTTKGNGGDINITTGSLFVTDDSFLTSSTNGEGNSGNITINARDSISFDRGSAYTDVGKNGKGQAGNFNITGESLSLTNSAHLIASTNGQGNAGNVTINTGSLSVVEGSFLAASANGQGNAGNININAGDRVLFDQGGKAYTNVTERGTGGNVTITTGSLTVGNGSKLDTSTSGVGDAGNITFNTKSANVQNNSQVIASTSSKVGNAGNITINTDSLKVTNESFLASSANGQGKAGNITIDARNVSFENGAKVYTDVNQLPFSDGTQVKGEGGNIKITSESLSLTDGAQLISNTQGEGNAGNIIINTGSFRVTNEAFLAASANGQKGNAGNITIDARDRVLFNKGRALSNVGNCSFISVPCTSSNNTIKGNGGNITIKTPSLQLMNNSLLATGVGEEASLRKNVEGNGGNISIYLRDDLSVDQSSITTRLFANGRGKAGDIIVTSPRVTLDNSGTLNAESASGNGGNINLQSDLLLLRRGALISTTAGTASAGGNGGNITINTPNGFIVSVKNENSDITANAFNGSGGVIKINALDIYNFTQRSREDLVRELGTNDPNLLNPQRLQTNDITAFSQTNPTLSGQVNIITPNIDPARGLVQLPTVEVNPPKLVASGCAAFDTGGSSFTVTGRGGLPPSPTEPLTNDVVWTDARLPAVKQPSANKPKAKPHSKPKAEPIAIVPATGWVFNKEKGEVTLISNVPNNSGLSSNPATCSSQK